MQDPLKVAPNYLRALADRIQGMMSSGEKVPGDGDGFEMPPGMDVWEKEFDMDNIELGEGMFKSNPPPWQELCIKYRGNSFLDPVPQVFKRRYVYDRDIGDKPVFRGAEEYSDIASATMTDFVMEDLDARLTRREFDVPWFETELPPDGKKGKPYTFFLIDVSGSMSGLKSMHACALAQVAAEKVFAEDGVFVLMAYGTTRKDAVECDTLPKAIEELRKLNFNSGTTYIGENLKKMSFMLSLRTPYPHDAGHYLMAGDCDKSRSKIFVVHDGEDTVEDVPLRVPVFSIALVNHHEMLEKLSKKTGGKYLHISKP